MRIALLLLLLTASAAAAAPTAPSGGVQEPATSPTATARAAARIPRSVWGVGADDLQINPQSGLQCPARLGAYRRDRVYAYDGAGLDVDCNYVAQGRRITLYLTRLDGADLGRIYDNAKTSLVKVGAELHPQLLAEGPRQDEGFSWRMALYGEDGGLHSSLWVGELDGWLVQYRATYPGDDDASIQADLSVFSHQIRASAGAHLDLCARSEAKPGVGKRIDTKDAATDAAMSGILMASAALAAEDGKAKPAAATTWCFAKAIAVGQHGFIAWRAVDGAGADGNAVRITPLTLDDPPALDIALDPAGAQIDSELGRPPRWTASWRRGPKTWVFAFYDGRPDLDDAARLTDDILAGKAHALSSYDSASHAVTISTPSK
ncbi:hypothetical protein ACO2Q3_03700 [Caulobacter sp. KR2-114]|uniref:hypothetical protein n=1 Tax=Caulobacter sp. KR2-114 TaxID=3400912 RepID=UPI003BFF6853